MKKLLILLAFSTLLCLVGCKNNENVDNLNNNQQNNNSQISDSNQNSDNTQKETGIIVYQEPDFTEDAGFKIKLGSGLENVTYSSVFLIHETTAQLDLQFPDGTKGTLLVDTNGYEHLYDADDTVLIGDIKVSIKIGADGIIVYEWTKNSVTYTYSTTKNIKDSEELSTLVNNVLLEQVD